MSGIDQLSDLDLAALVASKICHDAIGPMTAVGFGLDVLDEDEDDDDQRENALAMIRNGTDQITAKLQFARLAFGAAGSSGSEIDLMEAQKVVRQYVEGDKKHRIEWTSSMPTMPKNNVKLLLNLIAISTGTIPRGGTIDIVVEGDKDKPAISLQTAGDKARVPDGIMDLINGTPKEEVDARAIQSYFTGRVARTVGAKVQMKMEGQGVLLTATFA